MIFVKYYLTTLVEKMSCNWNQPNAVSSEVEQGWNHQQDDIKCFYRKPCMCAQQRI